MSDLLSIEQRAAIDAAIQDVADTFFKSVVVIHTLTGTFDLFSEGGGKTYTQYVLAGLAEYPGSAGDETIKRFGQLNEREVVVTFKYSAMKTAGIAEGVSGSKINEATDYMMLDNIRYDVVVAIPDGPIDAENLLYIVKGERGLRKS